MTTIDVRSLDAATRARQLAKPDGEIGLALADLMNEANGPINSAAFRALAAAPGHHLLEIGFGNGKLIPQLLALAPDLSYAGIDYAPTMLAAAETRNRDGIAAGRIALHHGTSDALPFRDGEFDRALAINVIYFWAEPARDFSEVFRVLKPGGAFVYNSMTPAYAATMPHSNAAHGFRIHDRPTLVDLARAAGFARTDVEVVRYIGVSAASSQPAEREFHLVTASKPG